MNPNTAIKSIAFLCLLMCSIHTRAQTLHVKDSLDLERSIATTIHIYEQFSRSTSNLYSGIEYIDYAASIKRGSPFLGAAGFTKGSVVCNNVLYENVSLAFDAVLNKLVTVVPATGLHVQLVSANISRFNLRGQQFIHITGDSSKSLLGNGFYELLYDGNTRVLKKTVKKIEENPGSLENYIQDKTSFYIRKNNQYHPVNNKTAVVALLENQGKEIKQFITRQHLNFRRHLDDALRRVAVYYDSINQ